MCAEDSSDDRSEEEGDEGAEHARDPLYDECVDDEEGDSAESRTETTLGLEVLDGCAEAGGDGLLLDEEELGLGGFVDGCVGVFGREGFEDDGFWGFNHEEGGNQTTECVFNLVSNVSGCLGDEGAALEGFTIKERVTKKRTVRPMITAPHVGNL